MANGNCANGRHVRGCALDRRRTRRCGRRNDRRRCREGSRGAISIEDVARAFVEEMRRAGQRVPGIGHRRLTTDPRVDVLFTMARDAKIAGDGIVAVRAIEKAVCEQRDEHQHRTRTGPRPIPWARFDALCPNSSSSHGVGPYASAVRSVLIRVFAARVSAARVHPRLRTRSARQS